jgi:alpha-amylase/alpha-mannosidase (GH57 family)
MRTAAGKLLLTSVVMAVLAAACTSSTSDETTTTAVATTAAPAPTTTTEPLRDPADQLNLVLMWHQHQPLYPKDEAGVVSRPWVRVHATKDYYDMAALVADYPDVHVTFNLTPVLMRQLEELTQGTKDIYWVMTEVPAEELTDEQRTFIIDRFFDTNAKIVVRFPRYEELIEKRDRPDSFTTAELRDLQVLFNLAWTDPSFLADEPLAGLVAKERNFTEADKAVVLDEHERIIAEVLPLHAALWETGQIEVTTTPLAHPILPLIADTDLATVGDPTGLKPVNRFRQLPDAVDQVAIGLDEAERLLGRRPTGMWPGEGAVAQLTMKPFAANGVEWVATGEDVLAKTLDIGSFTRDSNDLVEQADVLYAMYEAQMSGDETVAMFFRDVVLSDRIGFEYSGTEAAAAADDFMQRLADINAALDAADLPGPKVVSVILDGENAWESYDNDGIDFLNALYSRLAESDFVRTVTPSELLAEYGDAPQPLPDIFPASWFQPNFATWIGEEEEARAWDYLYRTRSDFGVAQRSGEYNDETIDAAYETMLFAEGSDWFWWYGADQDSGDDGYFDSAFRELLGQVYDALSLERPTFVEIPITPEPVVEPAYGLTELTTIEIDNAVATEDWSKAARYEFAAGDFVESLDYGFDKQNLYVRVGFGREVLDDDNLAFDLYLGVPGAGRDFGLSNGGTVLGFNGTHRLSWTGRDPVVLQGPVVHTADGGGADTTTAAGFDGESIEFAIPVETFGAVGAGDRITFRLVETSGGPDGPSLPSAGPGYILVPDISDVEALFEVSDPDGDDYGPGTYVYPEDGVFGPGSYDLTNFSVGLSGGDTAVFTFEVAAPIGNPWGSPAGYSIQTFDLYIDTDPGAGTGARLLLPGRNAALEEGNGWEYALTLEGWYPALYVAAADGSSEETQPTLRVIADAEGRVTARVPLELLGGGDPATWAYAVTLMSQEGFPSPGVRRIRDINETAEQWKGGGAPADANHSRIYDVLYPEEGVQESLLSDYEPAASVEGLGPDGYPQVPLVLSE